MRGEKRGGVGECEVESVGGGIGMGREGKSEGEKGENERGESGESEGEKGVSGKG